MNPSSRELEVLRAVATEGSHAEAAHALGISRETVHRHLVNLYAKLGVTGAINAMRQLGWLRLPQ